MAARPMPTAYRALDDFDQVAQNAPRSSVAQGVTEALRSDQTPPFSQMVSQLFDKSDPTQRAKHAQSIAARRSAGRSCRSHAACALGQLFRDHDSPAAITPEQAAQLTPDQVRQIAETAEQQNPSIVDRMGDFYAEHPTLVKTIGGAALAIVLGRVAEGMRH
ncbi:hypothetical protein LP419_08750 [Massilia sp. H-1]|nr:hypothetical protein LP419_08750 [Massilia sp. H-1]